MVKTINFRLLSASRFPEVSKMPRMAQYMWSVFHVLAAALPLNKNQLGHHQHTFRSQIVQVSEFSLIPPKDISFKYHSKSGLIFQRN